MNQAKMILHHIREHGSITVFDAEQPPINCKRLASRINDIKAGRGVEQANVDSRMITVPSGKRVAEYYEIVHSPLNERIKELEDIIYDYPENHPEIVKINKQIEELRG